MKEETICQIKRQFYAVNSKLSPLKKFTNFPLRHDKPVPLGQRILQIQILKPRIAKGGVVLPKELRLHEGLFILKFWIVGIGFALGLGDHSLMDLAVFALENEEVRRINPYILPSIAASFVALDLKLRHGSVTVVIDLQAQTLDFGKGQHFPQEYLLKAAVRVVGQVVERAILLGVGRILFAEHGQDIFLPHLLGQLHHRLCLLV